MRREQPINTFTFGRRVVTTKVHLMVNADTAALDIDVASFLDTPFSQLNDPIEQKASA
jgi:hypothetical protein